MFRGFSFSNYGEKSIQLLACAALVLSVGCGGGSVALPANANAQPPATSASNPGTSSSTGSGSGSTSGTSGTSSSPGTGSGSGAPPAQPPTFLYVALNDGFSVWSNVANTGSGAIGGFAVASDGTLQATPGSPYSGPAQSLAPNPAASALYAASGSTLNVNRVNSDGSLTKTATFNSQPLTPSIGLYEDLSFNPVSQFLYAEAIHGAGDNFFEIYKTAGDGGLSPAGSQQATVAVLPLSFAPSGARAYEPYCYHLDGEILGYNAGPDGKLTSFNTNASVPNLGQPDPACPYAISISADGSRVAAQLNGVGAGSALGFYTIAADGTLSMQGSPTSTTARGADIAWDASGRYVAVAAKDGLWLYSVSQTGTAVAVSGAPIVTGPMDHVAFNKAGSLLFATNASAKTLYVFVFNSTSGMVTPAPGSPHQMSLAPYALGTFER